MRVGGPAIYSCDCHKGSSSFNFERGGYFIQLTERPSNHSKSNSFQTDTVLISQRYYNLKKLSGGSIQQPPNGGGPFGPRRGRFRPHGPDRHGFCRGGDLCPFDRNPMGANPDPAHSRHRPAPKQLGRVDWATMVIIAR